MSKLSELLPAGGGGKQVDFVASGILPNGRAVVLKSNGQVEVVGETTVSLALPAASAVQYYSADTGHAYIKVNPYKKDQFVVAYTLGSNDYAYCVVGTVTGTTISFATPAAFSTTSSTIMGLAFDPSTSGSFVVTFHTSNNEYGTAIAGNISGNSLTFGTRTNFNSQATTNIKIAFDPSAAGVFIMAYRVGPYNSSDGVAIIGTVSGTSISYAGEAAFNGRTGVENIQFDPNQTSTCIIAFGDVATSNYGTLIVVTRSGNSLSFSSEYRLDNRYASGISLAFDPFTSGRFLVAFTDSGNSNDGYTMIGNLSGTSISLGSAQRFDSGNAAGINAVWDTSTSNSFILIYQNYGNNGYGTVIQCTASSTTATFGTSTVFVSASTGFLESTHIGSSSGKIVVNYKDGSSSGAGTSILLQLPAQITNLTATNFLGITDAAIASGASGSVTIKGGLKTELAGGTFAVTVANPGAGNRYYINGVLQQTLNLREGFTYKFDQSASSNSGHPFRFSITSNGTHAGGSEYTTGVTTAGTPGNAGAYTQIVVAASAPTLYYYCTNHSLMGGQANTIAAIVANSIYYVQGDGSISTVSTSPAVRIGRAFSPTSINLEFS